MQFFCVCYAIETLQLLHATCLHHRVAGLQPPALQRPQACMHAAWLHLSAAGTQILTANKFALLLMLLQAKRVIRAACGSLAKDQSTTIHS
jgi:hypothetical protein